MHCDISSCDVHQRHSRWPRSMDFRFWTPFVVSTNNLNCDYKIAGARARNADASGAAEADVHGHGLQLPIPLALPPWAAVRRRPAPRPLPPSVRRLQRPISAASHDSTPAANACERALVDAQPGAPRRSPPAAAHANAPARNANAASGFAADAAAAAQLPPTAHADASRTTGCLRNDLAHDFTAAPPDAATAAATAAAATGSPDGRTHQLWLSFSCNLYSIVIFHAIPIYKAVYLFGGALTELIIMFSSKTESSS